METTLLFWLALVCLTMYLKNASFTNDQKSDYPLFISLISYIASVLYYGAYRCNIFSTFPIRISLGILVQPNFCLVWNSDDYRRVIFIRSLERIFQRWSAVCLSLPLVLETKLDHRNIAYCSFRSYFKGCLSHSLSGLDVQNLNYKFRLFPSGGSF